MSSSGPRVVVAWPGGTFARPLPPRGVLTIGRGHGCDVPVDHPSVSRRHAELHVGASLSIRDLESANGTRVAGRLIASGELATLSGTDVVEIGDALLTIQGIRASSDAPVPMDAMVELARLVSLVARGTISVILLGETGVGKEVTAERIHAQSPRASRPMVRINCASLSEHLLESELFGHERGAFTGAVAAKVGLLEVADGSTIFLDEIAELSPGTQAKLLRVLEAKELTRVGAIKPRPIDVRIVCATNRDLVPLCAEQRFRADLYHRLNGITLVIPPLRQRRDEIATLARGFLERECEALAKPPLDIDAEAMAALEGHDWPGNVRQLRKTMERAALLCTNDRVSVQDLRLDRELASTFPSSAAPVSPPTPAIDLREEVADAERARIVATLQEFGGNQTRAAEALGISRRTLVSRLQEYGLPRPRKPS